MYIKFILCTPKSKSDVLICLCEVKEVSKFGNRLSIVQDKWDLCMDCVTHRSLAERCDGVCFALCLTSTASMTLPGRDPHCGKVFCICIQP